MNIENLSILLSMKMLGINGDSETMTIVDHALSETRCRFK